MQTRAGIRFAALRRVCGNETTPLRVVIPGNRFGNLAGAFSPDFA